MTMSTRASGGARVARQPLDTIVVPLERLRVGVADLVQARAGGSRDSRSPEPKQWRF